MTFLLLQFLQRIILAEYRYLGRPCLILKPNIHEVSAKTLLASKTNQQNGYVLDNNGKDAECHMEERK
jgi:hypothetical protein